MRRQVHEKLLRQGGSDIIVGDGGGEDVFLKVQSGDADQAPRYAYMNLADAEWLIDRLRFYRAKARRRTRERKRP